ncbi:MAG: hypothetical protein N2253_05075 [Bacteroidia bacterium]|nr:hypothetical protein [Bacteroidia bacterium]MCX7764248.1 hypothetical protein [Bacteroidia bacterium]MDW8057435.1 hypothetical protein [Bacteroidia bacterium]
MGRLGWLLLSAVGLWSCGKQANIFVTPYDKALRKALRRQGHGWVSAGSSGDTSFRLSHSYLQPGQFIRVVLEFPRPISSENQSWQKVRMDTLRIFEDSLVYLPWSGSIRLGGLTLDSARALLQKAVDQIFIGVQVRLYPLYAYYVYGQVAQQGRVLLDRAQIPLAELLALTPIQSREIDFSRVKILRGPPHYDKVFLVDARDADILTNKFLVQAEDVIVFEARQIIRSRIEIQNISAVVGILQFVNLVLFIFTIFRR